MDIKSAWLSKINWTQAISFAAMLLTMFGIDLPDDVRDALLATIVGLQAILTWVFKTFFTTTITPTSANKI